MEKPDAEIASERVAAERDEEDAGAKSSPPDGRKTPARGDINRASVNDAGVSARAGVEVDAARNGRRRSELVASVSPGDSSNSEVLAMFDSEEKEGDGRSESELAMIESEEEEGDEFCTLSASE